MLSKKKAIRLFIVWAFIVVAAICSVGTARSATGDNATGAPLGLSDSKIRYHLDEAERLYAARNWKLALSHYVFVLADLPPDLQTAVQDRIADCRKRLAAPGNTAATRLASQQTPTTGANAGGGSIGISYDQAMSFLGDVVTMREASPVDGSARYGGFNRDRSITIELCGDKEDLRSASIMASVPHVTGSSYDERLESFKASRAHVTCVGRFIMNLFPERDKEVHDWWVKSMETLSAKGGKAIQVFGAKTITAVMVKYSDGMLISVEVHRAAG